jgi:hypothetical protein
MSTTRWDGWTGTDLLAFLLGAVVGSWVAARPVPPVLQNPERIFLAPSLSLPRHTPPREEKKPCPRYRLGCKRHTSLSSVPSPRGSGHRYLACASLPFCHRCFCLVSRQFPPRITLHTFVTFALLSLPLCLSAPSKPPRRLIHLSPTSCPLQTPHRARQYEPINSPDIPLCWNAYSNAEGRIRLRRKASSRSEGDPCRAETQAAALPVPAIHPRISTPTYPRFFNYPFPEHHHPDCLRDPSPTRLSRTAGSR